MLLTQAAIPSATMEPAIRWSATMMGTRSIPNRLIDLEIIGLRTRMAIPSKQSDRTPVIATTSGNQITYSVLTFGGGRVSYVVTTTPITLNTHFGESGVGEESNYTVTAIQSIRLPDGSSYSFAYDNVGLWRDDQHDPPGRGRGPVWV